MCIYRNFGVHCHNHMWHGRAKIITYSECVSVALVIQHTMRMHGIVFSPVACLALPYFFTLCHKQHNFLEKVPEYKIVCFYLLHII